MTSLELHLSDLGIKFLSGGKKKKKKKKYIYIYIYIYIPINQKLRKTSKAVQLNAIQLCHHKPMKMKFQNINDYERKYGHGEANYMKRASIETTARYL